MRVVGLLLLSLSAGVALGCARAHERADDAALPARDAGPDARVAADAFVPEDAYVAPDASPCAPEPERCDGRDEDCDDLVDEDVLCSIERGAGACVGGACAISTCDDGFADCDGDIANGCEADLMNDRRACGACGVECRVSETCVEGHCEREEIVDLAYANRGYTGCVVLASGRLACWGHNEYGAIASGTVEDQMVPVEVDGISNVVRVAHSIGMVCAACADGRIRCRGGGEAGRVPEWQEIDGVVNASEIRAGRHHFCALEPGGRTVCWGKHLPLGSLGLGGDGPMIAWTADTPLGLPPAIVISADDANGCAVDEAGVTRCWGDLASWPQTSSRAEPLPIEVSYAFGATWLSRASTHGCFVTADGLLQCWGRDRWGGLGVASPTEWHRIPVTVAAVGPALRVWVTTFLSAALSRDHRVFWWGRDLTMPFDISSQPTRWTAQHVPEFDGAIRMVIGEMTICAQMSPTSLRCMGWNNFGALGDGSDLPRAAPVTVLHFE